MKSGISTAIILAGGLGTRLRAVVPDLPKPMAPVGGRPFLEHQFDYWILQGISRFVLAVGYRHDDIRGHFGSAYGGARLDYVVENSPLGTGGGFLLALEALGHAGPFLLLNGDTYFAVDLDALAAFSRRNEAECCFSLFRTGEQGRYMGLDVAPGGRIRSLSSDASRPGRLANGGVYLIESPALLRDKFVPGDKASLEQDIFPAALASGGRLFGLEFPGTFIDIGLPGDYRRAEELLLRAPRRHRTS